MTIDRDVNTKLLNYLSVSGPPKACELVEAAILSYVFD